MKVRFLTVTEVIRIHANTIDRFGGMCGIRDINLLESAVYAPQATFSGKYLYKDIFSMTATYVYSIVNNHPFVDGNKRTGLMSSLLFLGYNGYEVDESKKLYDLTMAIANSKISQDNVAEFFKIEAKIISQG